MADRASLRMQYYISCKSQGGTAATHTHTLYKIIAGAINTAYKTIRSSSGRVHHQFPSCVSKNLLELKFTEVCATRVRKVADTTKGRHGFPLVSTSYPDSYFSRDHTRKRENSHAAEQNGLSTNAEGTDEDSFNSTV